MIHKNIVKVLSKLDRTEKITDSIVWLCLIINMLSVILLCVFS